MSNNSSKILSNIDPRTLWKWKLPAVKIVKKHDFYCNLVKGKKVLHIGCTDHKQLIDIKFRNNTFLHTKLMNHAEKVHGVDINLEAIVYLRDKYRLTNIFYCDILQSNFPDGLFKTYDIILIPEVIEHILDLGSFLKSAKKFMSSKSLLVISTPNSLRVHNFFTVFKDYEEVNPDHKYFFSFSTLKSLLEETGYSIDKWFIYIHGNPYRRFFKYGINNVESIIKGFLIMINPWFGDGIIVQACLNNNF